MTTTWKKHSMVVLGLSAGLVLTACSGGAGAAAGPGAHPATTVLRSALADAPCGPTDCVPCDHTKQKCMGPMVCDNHPERAWTICARDPDGQCRSKLVCD